MTDTTYYKVLDHDGSACHGGNGVWHRNGKWMPEIEGELQLCRNAYHLCRREHLVLWLGPEIWEARAKGEIAEHDHKVGSRGARLVRRLKTWNERTARLFAADCAERVLHLIDNRGARRKCANAIDVSRAYANGEATETELAAAKDICIPAGSTGSRNAELAARAAVRNAARNATIDAASDAAKGAARTAVWATAESALGAAARHATAAAEREWQTERLFDYLEGRAG